MVALFVTIFASGIAVADDHEGGSAGFIASIMIFAVVLVLVAAVMFFAQRYKRCPPDQIMVIYGRTQRTPDGKAKPSKVLHGGAALVWPLIQDFAYISLKPMTINIDLRGALSLQNIRINVPSTFTIGVSTEEAVRNNAAERLLGFKVSDIEEMAKEIIFGQLRLTVATLTIEQINQDRDSFLELIQKNVGAEMRKVGLYLINVNIADITDESDYIESIGKKAAATAVEQARIDVANAERDGAIGKAEADRVKEIQVAQNTAEAEKGRKAAQADQRVYVEQQEAMAVGGENAAQAEIASANADLAEAEASAKQRADVATAQAEAEIQKAVYQEEESKLRASEIARETVAKQQVEIAADAEAERQRRIARGEADAILARYEAEAEGIQKVLDAKAHGYNSLVASASGDPKAAATLLMVEKIEAMVSAQTEAIRNLKIDKITVWDSGNNADGNSATSNFVSSLVQSLPPIHDVAKMSGVELPDYLGSMTEESDES